MNTNAEKLLFKDEVFQIVGCAIEVLNTLGHGIVEKPYENALVVEFGLRKIPSGSSMRSTFSIKARKLVCSFRTSSLSILSSWIRK
jgi:GxxExxY protein